MNNLLRARAFYLGLSTLLTILIASCSAAQRLSEHKVMEIHDSQKGASHETAKNAHLKRTWKRSALIANSVKIKVGDKESLAIHSMNASIKVDGFRARVVLDYHFYNHHNRNFEATFQLRLPNGASPYYLAFGESIYRTDSPQFQNGNLYNISKTSDIGFEPEQIRQSRSKTTIKLREARMVSRKTAVRAYHNTVHKRVDPALLEWTGSGVFNGRLFPIQAKKLHRVVVAYDVDLRQTNSHYHFTFPLPNKIKHKRIRFNIATIRGSRVNLKNHYQKIARHNRTQIDIKNPRSSALHLTIRRKSVTVLTGLNQVTKQENFILRLNPKLAYRNTSSKRSRAIFLVDISLGSQPESFNRSLNLLTQILARNQHKIKKFAVLFFNARGFWWRQQYSQNTFSNRKSISRYASNLSLQGASDLDLALTMGTQHKLINPKQADIYLLSDGASNWGDTRINTIARKFKSNFKNKLFAFSTSTVGVNNSVLNRLSSISNGAHYTVVNDSAIRKAATATRSASWKIRNVSITNGRDLIIKGNPSQVYPGQILTIAGRGTPKAGNIISLTLTNGKNTKIRKYRISKPIRSTLANRSYGIIAVKIMESLQQKRENKIIESYALHYKVVGRNASLLMLESERDYQNYNIKPSDNLLIVSQTRVSKVIATLQVLQRKSSRSDKEVFITLLNRLKYTDGVKTTLSKKLQQLIATMPASNFSMHFDIPMEYKAIHLLSKQFYQKINSNRKSEAIDIKSNRATQLIIDKYNELLKAKQFSKAVVALSSLLELNPGKVKTMQLVSYYLLRMKQNRDAWFLFQQITHKRPQEPSAYLALARIASANGKPQLASLYYEILLGSRWDHRFSYFARLARIEYTMLLRKTAGIKNSAKYTGDGSIKSFTHYASKRLTQLSATHNSTTTGLVVAIEWNTMGADVDLHIKNPDGEHIYHAHRLGRNGLLENDNTRGMGPEVFRTPSPLEGTYKVGVKYYGNNSNRASLRTAVLVNIYRNLGTGNAYVERKVIMLDSSGKVVWLTQFSIE